MKILALVSVLGSISFFTSCNKEVEGLPIEEFQKKNGIHYCPKVDLSDFIEEPQDSSRLNILQD